MDKLLRKIGLSGRSIVPIWYPCPNVNVVVGMLGADKQATTEFHNTYDFEGMRFCYTESIKIARLKCHQVRRKHIRDFLREKDRKRL